MLRLAFAATITLPLLCSQLALAQTPPEQPAAPAQADAQTEPTAYRLGAGDKLRITVFNEATLSGEYQVDGSGNIAMQLVGSIDANGRTAEELTRIVEQKLRNGYLRNPSVAIEVLSYRPFYVLGEVNQPGKYPYVTGMTVLGAVALAGGYTYRAKQSSVRIVRANDPEKKERKVDKNTIIMPGDIIRVTERFF